MKCLNDNKGYTLVEILTVLGILSAIFGIMALTVQTALLNFDTRNNKAIAEHQIQIVAQSISRDINSASAVNPSSPYGFPLVLACYRLDESSGIIVNNWAVTYSLSNSILTRTDNNGVQVIAGNLLDSPASSIALSDNNTYVITIGASSDNITATGVYRAQKRLP